MGVEHPTTFTRLSADLTSFSVIRHYCICSNTFFTKILQNRWWQACYWFSRGSDIDAIHGSSLQYFYFTLLTKPEIDKSIFHPSIVRAASGRLCSEQLK